MAKSDLIVGDRTIHSTSDYSQFKVMEGNRNVSRVHVKELQRLMIDNGNLTNNFPIIVNKNFEVLDGQHRLQALQELGWEVAYVIEDGATINMVRAINLGNKNWNWRDIAESYETLGNHEYGWFLRYLDRHGLSFSIAMRFCDLNAGRNVSSSDYYQGYLFIADKTKAEEMAEHYKEVLKYLPEDISQREIAYSIFNLRKSPYYDGERMIHKLEQLGHTLPLRASVPDYTRKLEEIFNNGYAPENKARLF